MTTLDKILAIKDWRHPYPIEGQILEKESYRPWHPWRLSVDLPNLQTILGGDLAGKRILDVGCNDGWFSFEYEKVGANVLGVEAREEAVRRANLIKTHFGSKADFVCGDLEKLTFSDPQFQEPFDVVLFYGILYHLSDPINVLRKMGDLSRRAIAVQSWMYGEDRKPVLRFRKDPQHMAGSGMTELVTAPSQSAVVVMLKNAGFDHVYRADPKPYMAPKWNPNARASWHFGFFYGVKGDKPQGLNAVEIDENSPPLNPFSPLERTIDLGRRSVKRLLRKPLTGGY